MKINLRNIRFVLPFIVVLVIASNLLYFTLNRGKVLDDTCVSVLRTEDKTVEFYSTETTTLVVNPDNTGYIAFSGHIISHGKSMTLFRELRFTYQQESDGIYKLSNIETVKHTRDNTPDALFDSVFFSIRHEKARYMTVRKVMNSYVIGNLYSPVFICVVK